MSCSYMYSVLFIFPVKKPGRPPPPTKPEEKPQEPVDSGSSGEESDDDQEQENLEVETKVDLNQRFRKHVQSD